MTSFVVHNSGGYIEVGGKPVPAGCSCGFEIPAVISGSGSFYITCNPNPPILMGEHDVLVALDKTNPDETVSVKENIYKPATSVSIDLTDSLGLITTVIENTRYPEEWDYPLTREITVT